MAGRTKRTYSLKSETLVRVRELAARYGTSQDQLVDAAVERLHREARDLEEAEAWAASADDAGFREERRRLEATFDSDDRWPA